MYAGVALNAIALLDQLQLNASIMRKFNYKIPIEFSGGGVKSEEMDCDETPPRNALCALSDVLG